MWRAVGMRRWTFFIRRKGGTVGAEVEDGKSGTLLNGQKSSDIINRTIWIGKIVRFLYNINKQRQYYILEGGISYDRYCNRIKK